MNLFKEVLRDTWFSIEYFMRSNIRHFANFFEFALPYCMFYAGMNNTANIAVVMVVPILMFLGIHILRSFADKLGTGNRIPPVPNKRFTQVDDDGEVSIENSRLQELILYVADLEDWLERKNAL